MAEDKKAAQAAPDPVPEAAGQPTAAASGLDKTVPGGKYRTQAGDWVDAEGNPLKG